MKDISATDLPAFQEWRRQFVPELGPAEYLEHETSLVSAMLVAELIFPRLIDVRGCVIRQDRYQKSAFDEWWDELHGDREQIERVLNFLQLTDVFDPVDSIERTALDVLAQRIALGWRTQADLQFPDRGLTVEVVPTDEDGPYVLLYGG